MTDQFDPYYAWLGIPPEERPADYYRLLGVRQFESNRDAIGNALDQRMAHLRSMQNGPRAAQSQNLLNELAAAGACLLEPQKKRDYDERLRQRQLAPVTLVNAAPAIDVSPARGPARSRPARGKPSKPRSMPAGWTIAGALAGLLCLTAAVIALLPPREDRQQDPLAGGGRAGQARPSGPYLQLPVTSPPPSPPPSAPSQSTPDEGALPTTGDVQPDVPSRSADPPPASTAANPNAADQQSLPTEGPFAIRLRPGDGVELADTKALIDWTRPFTLEAIVRASGQSQQLVLGNCILGGHPQSPEGTTGWQLWLMPAPADDQVRLALATGRGFWGQASRSTTWRHLSAASDGATLRLFVDGRLASERPVTALGDNQLPARLNLTIGAHHHLHAQQPAGLEGQIRGLRISLACLYESNFAPPESLHLSPDTLLLLDFEHPLAGRIRDLSPAGHHGTLRGAHWVSLAEAEDASAASSADPDVAETDVAETDVAETDVAETDVAETASDEPVVVADQQLAEAVLPRPPADQQLAASVESLRDVFREDLAAAKTPQSTRRLAQELLALARQADQPPDFRFALFCEAHRLLVESDDLPAALPVVDEMERHFRYQGSQRRLSALKAFVERLQTMAQRRQFVDLALQVAARAAGAEQFEQALEATRMAQGQAGRLADMELRRRAREGRIAVESARRRLQTAESARDKLQETPEDPLLSGVWGRYLCFVRQDWPQGLPLLAQCDDNLLQAAARADLQAPAAAADQASLADQWWSLAESLAEHERAAARDRACYWYRLATPQLEGVAKVRAAQRLEAAGLSANDPSEVALLFQRAMQQPLIPAPGVGVELAAMVGRLQVNGRDGGLLLHYENGVRFTDESLRDVMQQAGVPAGPLQLTLQGLFRLPQAETIVIRHRGGSLNGGRHSLAVNGRLQGEVGGGGAADAIYRLTLPSGDHTLQWSLSGGDLGACQLLLISAQGQPLTLFHSPPMAAAARRPTTRQTINMVR